MSAVLDAGALIAIDRGDRNVHALLRVLQRDGVPVRTSGAVVGQVWRGGARQARLARLLQGVESASLTGDVGKRIGELLAVSRSSDIVDAHVALLVSSGDVVLTSDPGDIKALLRGRKTKASVVNV